ncbi:hypothetical protein Tco_1493537 [Tanacetum coccineum]
MVYCIIDVTYTSDYTDSQSQRRVFYRESMMRQRWSVWSYPMDGGDDGDDDDGDSSRDDADDEEEEEHLAPADSAVVVPTVKPDSPPEGTSCYTKPPFSTYILPMTRITVRSGFQSLSTKGKGVRRLLAMPTPPPSPPISLSPPSAGERLARCTAPSAHSSPPLVPSPLLPSSGCPTQIQTLRMASTQALVDVVTAALPSPPLPPLPQSLYIPPPVDLMDDLPESELPPRKRDTWVDPADAVCEITPTTLGEVNTRVTELAELHERDTQDLYALLEELRMHTRPYPGTSDTTTAVEYSHSDTTSEMGDMQTELLALRGQQRARQPRPDVRIPDHQDSSGDADSHI